MKREAEQHRFSNEAEFDLEEITFLYDRIASCGKEFVHDVMQFVSIIALNPHGFSLAPGCPRGREIRVVKIGRFDYLLYHEVLIDEVVTIAIQHAKRKSAVWRKRTP